MKRSIGFSPELLIGSLLDHEQVKAQIFLSLDELSNYPGPMLLVNI